MASTVSRMSAPLACTKPSSAWKGGKTVVAGASRPVNRVFHRPTTLSTVAPAYCGNIGTTVTCSTPAASNSPSASSSDGRP